MKHWNTKRKERLISDNHVYLQPQRRPAQVQAAADVQQVPDRAVVQPVSAPIPQKHGLDAHAKDH